MIALKASDPGYMHLFVLNQIRCWLVNWWMVGPAFDLTEEQRLETLKGLDADLEKLIND